MASARGCTIPLPGTIGSGFCVFGALTRVNTFATSRFRAAALALIAAATWSPVLLGLPAGSVPSSTTRSSPVTVTVSGELGAPGLRNSAVMSLPPSWPQDREVRTMAPAWSARAGMLPVGVWLPAIVAWARRW